MAARAAAVEDRPAPAPLVLDQLIQVLDNNGTWHAATIGQGVLCSTIRDAVRTSSSAETYDRTTTVRWDYGVDQVDCPETACWSVLGRL